MSLLNLSSLYLNLENNIFFLGGVKSLSLGLTQKLSLLKTLELNLQNNKICYLGAEYLSKGISQLK